MTSAVMAAVRVLEHDFKCLAQLKTLKLSQISRFAREELLGFSIAAVLNTVAVVLYTRYFRKSYSISTVRRQQPPVASRGWARLALLIACAKKIEICGLCPSRAMNGLCDVSPAIIALI